MYHVNDELTMERFIFCLFLISKKKMKRHLILPLKCHDVNGIQVDQDSHFHELDFRMCLVGKVNLFYQEMTQLSIDISIYGCCRMYSDEMIISYSIFDHSQSH